MDIEEKIEKYLDEAKKANTPAFGSSEGRNYAVKIDGIPNDFFKLPYGRQLDYRKELKKFQQTAKKSYVDAKGKPTMKSVKDWVKKHKPSEFYAKWRKDSKTSKDDNVEILYKD